LYLKAVPNDKEDDRMAPWTFLTNHAIVFIFLTIHPFITGRALSRLIGITERSVRNYISDLESAGYIEKSKAGRHVRYKVNPDLPFRHQTQRDKAIGILLKALGWKPKHKRAKR
jgi:DNA-binding transcriptional ArsR family regulator